MTSIQILGRNRPAPPLVLVHAFPTTSEMYARAAVKLLDLQPRRSVVLVNLPGFGDAPLQKGWTMVGAMRELHTALAHENIRSCIIGGTSMGGYAAFAYYRLFAEEVQALILSNTKAGADDDAAKAGREEYAMAVERDGTRVAITRQLGALLSADTVNSNPSRIEELRTMISSIAPQAIAEALRAMALREDSTDLLASITCPTLVISSATDALIPSSLTKEIALGVEGATFQELTGIGHLSPFESPDMWAEVVNRFLQQRLSA